MGIVGNGRNDRINCFMIGLCVLIKYAHCLLLSIDLAIEDSYQELFQQKVAFGCIKRVDLPTLSNIFRKLAL